MLFIFIFVGFKTLKRPLACCNTTGSFPDIKVVDKACGYAMVNNGTSDIFYTEVKHYSLNMYHLGYGGSLGKAG